MERAYLKGRHSLRGTATVEMALLLPLVLLLTTGLLEYGWVFLKVQQLNSAARNGARLASLPDANSATVTSAIVSDLERAGLGASGYEITITPADLSAPQSGEPVSVSISVDYDRIKLTGVRMVPTPDLIRASVTMAKEGP